MLFQGVASYNTLKVVSISLSVFARPDISIPVHHQILAHIVLQFTWEILLTAWITPPFDFISTNFTSIFIRKELAIGLYYRRFPRFTGKKETINKETFLYPPVP